MKEIKKILSRARGPAPALPSLSPDGPGQGPGPGRAFFE